MLRKFILSTLALVLLAPPVFVAFENFRGRTQLEGVLADLRAKGEPLEIEKIAPPPVPAHSNAIARFVDAADALKLDTELQPIALRLIGPGRAVAGARLAEWTATSGRMVQWSDLALWQSNHQADLTQLREALDAPFRQPVLDYSQGFKLLLPHLAKMKSAVNVLGACMSDAAHRKDFGAALDDLEDMRQIARDLEKQPLLIDQLVRVACEAIATGRAWELLHSHDWTEAQLADLQSTVAPIDLISGMIHALTGERALVVATFQKMSTRELMDLGNLSGNGSPGSSVDGVGIAGAGLARVIWGDQALAQYLRTFQVMLDANREAAKSKSMKPFDSLHSLVPTTAFNPRYFLVRMILPALDRAGTKALRAETERDLLVTGIAIRRYQLGHNGKPPADLQALIPTYLDAMPIDRMDGQPLRYRAEADNSYTLWSVGDDRADNGGDGQRTTENSGDRSHANWWLARDAVWPRHATAEEMSAWQQEDVERRDRRARKGTRPSEPLKTMDPELLKRYGLQPPTNTPANPPVPSDRR
ncbi:MAG: hypothetical protein JNK85_22100 [Verrucomicrobiales bacterium]|nr:hypothetical protein [Verrucomicrobiales bacterium]